MENTKKYTQSTINALAKRIMHIFKVKTWHGEDTIKKLREVPEKPYKLPLFIKFKNSIKKQTIADLDCYIVSSSTPSKKVVLYFHGGAYVSQIIRLHWWFIDNLCTKTNATFIIPIYPKAPYHTHKETYKNIPNLYDYILHGTHPKNIIFMGDSAGGGMALASAQLISKSTKFPQPSEIVLISPWIDVATNNPEIRKYESVDPMLGIDYLRACGRAWAGKTKLDNYLLSPLFGNIRNLAHINIFIGTYEILLPDAQKLRDKIKNTGLDVNYHEYPLMTHDFPIYPIPDSKKSVNEIIKIINKQ